MNRIKIYAGIVTYNPDIQILKRNIDSLLKQVEEIVIFDNGSENINELVEEVYDYDNLLLLKNGMNSGIAHALNELMDFGLEHNYKYMLTLDQDSYCNVNFIKKMIAAFEINNEIGVVAPVIIDRDTKEIIGHSNSNEKYSYIKTCISSGAIVDIDVWDQVGRYDEKMFIDNVDIDFCYRVRKNGYFIIQVNEEFLEHKIGNLIIKRLGFIKIKIYGHSSFRKYYIAKNNIYCPLKNGLYLRMIYGNLKNLKLLLIIFMFESNKKEKIRRFISGWHDGYKVGK